MIYVVMQLVTEMIVMTPNGEEADVNMKWGEGQDGVYPVFSSMEDATVYISKMDIPDDVRVQILELEPIGGKTVSGDWVGSAVH